MNFVSRTKIWFSSYHDFSIEAVGLPPMTFTKHGGQKFYHILYYLAYLGLIWWLVLKLYSIRIVVFWSSAAKTSMHVGQPANHQICRNLMVGWTPCILVLGADEIGPIGLARFKKVCAVHDSTKQWKYYNILCMKLQ